MRRAWAGAVILLAALALAGSADGGGEVSELERTPHFLVVRVSGPFDEVMLLLQEAIKRRNYGITSINNLDDTLSRRAAETGGTGSPYQHYKVIGFCNLTLADDALRRHPYVGAFLPCRAAVYQSAGERSTTIVAVRPTVLVPALHGAGLEAVMAQAEIDLVGILTDVSAWR